MPYINIQLRYKVPRLNETEYNTLVQEIHTSNQLILKRLDNKITSAILNLPVNGFNRPDTGACGKVHRQL